MGEDLADALNRSGCHSRYCAEDILRMNARAYQQSGGEDRTYEMKISGKTYVIQIRSYSNKSNLDDKIEYIVVSFDKSHSCVTIVVKKDGETANIQSVQKNPFCAIQVDLEKRNHALSDHIGTTMMWIAIEWCKYRNIKVLTLDDNARVHCGSDLSFSLSMAYTMSHGYPWYVQFGFEYTEEAIQEMMQYNIQVHKGVLTNSIPSDLLMKHATKSKYKDRIMDKYTALATQPAHVFLSWLQTKDCVTYANAQLQIYTALGYKILARANMHLYLWPQKVELQQKV